MAICDQLEAQLDAASLARQRLLARGSKRAARFPSSQSTGRLCPRCARTNEVRNNEGPAEARAAKLAIEHDLAEDNAEYGDLLDQRGARLLRFPGRAKLTEPEFGPFGEPGTLDGVPIVVGGENDPVPVHLQDRGRVHNCLASRDVAKAISQCLFTTPIRASGMGRWMRAADGSWELRRFLIQSFVPLRAESLQDATERLRAVDAAWKRSDHPIGDMLKRR